MNLFTRILTPLCGHAPVIADLEHKLAAAREDYAKAGRRVTQFVVSNADLAAVNKHLGEQIGDMAGSLEETNSRIAVLTASNNELLQSIELLKAVKGLTDDDLSEQLALLHAPAASSIDEDDVAPQDDELVAGPSTAEEAWRLVAVVFDGRRRWVLRREKDVITVSIHDKEWMERVHRREVTFGAGDLLLVEMTTTTYRSTESGEPYVIRAVQKVIRVVPPSDQLPLLEEPAVAGGAA